MNIYENVKNSREVSSATSIILNRSYGACQLAARLTTFNNFVGSLKVPGSSVGNLEPKATIGNAPGFSHSRETIGFLFWLT
ncbi:MAG: hypothetical protein ABI472_12865 [Ginsengibacter sp.]